MRMPIFPARAGQMCRTWSRSQLLTVPLASKLFARLLIAIVFFGNMFGAAQSYAEDWPQWRGPRGDGTWNGPRIQPSWPASGLPQVWKQPLGGGYSGITVWEHRVLALDRQTAPVEMERILCLDATTGERLWRHSYPVKYGELSYGNGPRACATIHEGRVYTLGALGQACCLNLEDGNEIWSVDTVQQHGATVPMWGHAASPLIWKDLVILHVGAKPEGCFIALNRQSGELVWKGGQDDAGYATPIVAVQDSGEQLIGWTPEHVVGMSLESGKVEWTIPYKVTYGVSIASPLFQEGLVLVSGYWEGSKAIRLSNDRTQVELAWEDNESLRGLMSSPLYRDGRVYFLDKQFGVTCLELASGKKQWDDHHRLTPRDRNPHVTLVWTGSGKQVLALNSEGELILAQFDEEGVQELARAKIIGPTWAHPAFAGKHVFARNDEEIVCVELPVEEAK